MPPSPAQGRPRMRRRLTPGEPCAQAVRDVAAPLPPSAWQRRPMKIGRQGPLYADFAALRVVASRRQLPGPDVWRLLRRHPDTHTLKTYLGHGPAHRVLDDLVWLACAGPLKPASRKANCSWAWGIMKAAAGSAGTTI